MIVIQQDVWRADCIAAIGTDEHLIIQVYPVGTTDTIEYEYNSIEERFVAYNIILPAWISAVEAMQK